jgi:hypothetical protein
MDALEVDDLHGYIVPRAEECGLVAQVSGGVAEILAAARTE